MPKIRAKEKRATIDERVESVRASVAEASTGLNDAEYREFFEELLADAEGWRMELAEKDDA